MTPEDAIQRFYEVVGDAVGKAIRTDAAIAAALHDLHTMGLGVESYSLQATVVRIAEQSPANADQNFLRKLRITPDLEVRE